ncbi:multidrug effflux MFS transporter [Magnetococcus sp. PR-3]|uniref:multidrug effflux MFS transporter n=1 Tax=Magnetococcus sp. PR-3 TaxID=3120355 RepID=UPI002FCE3D8B
MSEAPPSPSALSNGEFIPMLALMISLVALSIDAMLPALEVMGQALGTQGAKQNQLIISILFMGFAVGQLFYGPLSDSTGRRPMIFIGLLIFMVGSVLSLYAENFQAMLLGRFLQGLGAASPRTIATALVRDIYAGRQMARIMSMIMSVFILVPVLAPTLGQWILMVAHWRMIFGLLLLLSLVVLCWFGWRQPETLHPEYRRELSWHNLWQMFKEASTHPATLGYTIANGLIFGAFVGYLVSSQQILQNHYALGSHFPYYFGGLALSVGLASVANAQLVMHWGMRYLSQLALMTLSGLSTLVLLYLLMSGNPLPLGGMMVWALIAFFCIGILMGNVTALALEPMGHMAGVASSVVGAFSSFIAVSLGTGLGQAFNGTLIPLIGGFALFNGVALLVILWVERKHAPAVAQKKPC